MLGVGDGVADDALEEGFEDAAGFFVDHCSRGVSKMGAREVGRWKRGGGGLGEGNEGEKEGRRTYWQKYA